MREKFIPANNDLCYYPLLYLALEETKSGDIVEMGTGHGSTPLLHDYCTKNKRELWSYETNKEWSDKFTNLNNDFHFVHLLENADWNFVKENHDSPAVVFIDHAPGERRKEDIVNFKDINGIIVCHDTEEAADQGYQMRGTFKEFKYVVEIKTNGAEAAAMSNHYDVTKWAGQTFGNYKIG